MRNEKRNLRLLRLSQLQTVLPKAVILVILAPQDFKTCPETKEMTG